MNSKFTAQQIEQIRNIRPFAYTNFHGNRKKVGFLPVNEYIRIADKITARYIERSRTKRLNKYELLRQLIEDSRNSKGTPYFKVLIEGNTGIYYASPVYGHSDYNKSRVFDNTPENKKLIEIFNKLVNK